MPLINIAGDTITSMLDSYLNGWVKSGLINIGNNLAGSPVELSKFLNNSEFLGKSQTEEFIEIIKAFYRDRKNLNISVRVQYSLFVEKYYKDVVPLMKKYVKFFDKFENAKSTEDLINIKNGLLKWCNVLKTVSKSFEYNKYTTEEFNRNEGKETYSGKTLGNFIGEIFIPLIDVSVKNLKENEYGKCVIYIGNQGVDLKHNELGLKNIEVKVKRGVPQVNDIKHKVESTVSHGDSKKIEEYRVRASKLYDEAVEIHNKMKINYYRINDKSNESVRKYKIMLDIVHASICGSGECLCAEESNNFDISVSYKDSKTITLIKSKDNILDKSTSVVDIINSYHIMENNVKLIKKIYKNSIDFYKTILRIRSQIDKLKRECDKYVPVIKSSKGIDILEGNLKASFEMGIRLLSYFSKEISKLEENEIKDLVKLDLEEALEKANKYYEFIKFLYKIKLKSKKLNDIYGEICSKGFGEIYNKEVINKFKKDVYDLNVDNFFNSLDILNKEIVEAKIDLKDTVKFQDSRKELKDFSRKNQKFSNSITNIFLLQENKVRSESIDREKYRKCLAESVDTFSDTKRKWESECQNKKTEKLSKNPLKRAGGKILKKFSRRFAESK